MKNKSAYCRPQAQQDCAVIGSFFCAYDDRLLGSNLWREPPNSTLHDANASELKVITSNESKKQDALLEISAELSVKVACFQLSGGARYMKRVKTNRDTASSTVIHRWRSTIQIISNTNHLQQDAEALQKALEMGATHIVTQITYDGRANLYFETKVQHSI